MCWHRWTKWEQYSETFSGTIEGGLFVAKEQLGRSFTSTEHKQKRHCTKCNKEQVETIWSK